MRRIATSLVTAIVLAVPATARAAPVSNKQADRAAIAAYSGYLQSEVNGIPKGKAADSAFVNRISSGSNSCSGALATAVQNAGTDKARLAALRAIGTEIGYDVALSFQVETDAPYRTLAARLTRLRWNDRQARGTITAFTSALHNLLSIKTSHLCGDALYLAGQPTVTPSATTTFNAKVKAADGRLNTAFNGFVKLIERYETTGETGSLNRINRLADEYARTSSPDNKAAIAKLDTALEQSS